MKQKPIITNHAKERLKSRSGLKKKSIDRIVQRAFDEGITQSQTKGRLKKWVDGLFFYNMTATNIRLYGDKAYIFKKDILVTIIAIPPNIKRDLNKMIKKGKELNN